jgi:hypothetical protein
MTVRSASKGKDVTEHAEKTLKGETVIQQHSFLTSTQEEATPATRPCLFTPGGRPLGTHLTFKNPASYI